MNKKTAGIITFHQALNYGAVLQAYALKAVCDKMGYDAHVVDYSYSGDKEKVAPVAHFFAASNKKSALPGLIRGLLSYPGSKRREQAFHAFRRKYLNETAPCSGPVDISALGYDVLIGGSDQIWNQGITLYRYDPVFFMNFDTSAKKILYAASSEDVPFSAEKEAAFVRALEGLQGSVSIREKKLADYVQALTGKQHPVVLDPTLLAGKEILEAIPTPPPPADPYILLYQIDSNPASDICVASLEKRFGCPVYTMTVPRVGSTHGRKGTAGPEEFLSLLKGAQFLVTNSFHGIALSIIFGKQFFVYENGGVMSRIDGLLALTGLQDRRVKMVADIDTGKQIAYEEVNEKLSVLRSESRAFLERAMQD